MDNFVIINSIAVSEYLIIASIVMMIANFLVTLFSLILRGDVLYNDSGSHLSSNVLLLVFEIAYMIFAAVIFSIEKLYALLSLPILTGAFLFTFMLIWNFVQMRGISIRSMEVLETLVGVIEAGDENLDGHSLHVQNLTMLIYDYLPYLARRKINPIDRKSVV